MSQVAPDTPSIAESLDRGDRALERIVGALETSLQHRDRDDALRLRVRDVIGELDQMIRDASLGAGAT